MIDTTSTKNDPNKFFDTLITLLKVKNDAALSELLDVHPPTISKIRHRKLPVGFALLLRIHELTNLPVKEIRTWAEVEPIF
jgi:hypothetical protein